MRVRDTKLKACLFRQKGMCLYCRMPLTLKEATLDHIKPTSKGGDNSMRNMAAACFACNNLKANFHTMEELDEFYEKIKEMIWAADNFIKNNYQL